VIFAVFRSLVLGRDETGSGRRCEQHTSPFFPRKFEAKNTERVVASGEEKMASMEAQSADWAFEEEVWTKTHHNPAFRAPDSSQPEGCRKTSDRTLRSDSRVPVVVADPSGTPLSALYRPEFHHQRNDNPNMTPLSALVNARAAVKGAQDGFLFFFRASVFRVPVFPFAGGFLCLVHMGKGEEIQ
jgi:hypothetical protein